MVDSCLLGSCQLPYSSLILSRSLSLSSFYLLSFFHSSLTAVTSLLPSPQQSRQKMPSSMTYFHTKTIRSLKPLYLHPPIQSAKLTIQADVHKGSAFISSTELRTLNWELLCVWIEEMRGRRKAIMLSFLPPYMSRSGSYISFLFFTP